MRVEEGMGRVGGRFSDFLLASGVEESHVFGVRSSVVFLPARCGRTSAAALIVVYFV